MPEKTLPEKYEALKKEKIAAGLSPDDAHEVTERQMARDQAAAKPAAKPSKTEKTEKSQ